MNRKKLIVYYSITQLPEKQKKSTLCSLRDGTLAYDPQSTLIHCVSLITTDVTVVTINNNGISPPPPFTLCLKKDPDILAVTWLILSNRHIFAGMLLIAM